MKLLRPSADRARRGAALLLSLLLLFVLVAIAIQISVTTGTDARVARNDLTLTSMDLAIESAMLQVQETLKTDAEAAGAESGAPAPDAGAQQGAQQQQGQQTQQGGAPGQGGGSSDTRKDEWASPQRTEINDVRLRIVVVDEDSKYNVLNLLNPDEKEAQTALGRVSRILDGCREGTELDIDSRTAEEMARAMLEHLSKRDESRVPRPKLLTDDETARERGLPRSLLEFAGLPPFEPMHFRDIRDANGKVAHSIGAFLTVWTGVSTAGDVLGVARTGQGGAQGGGQTGTAAGGAASSQSGGGTEASKSGTQSGGAQGQGGQGSQAGGAQGSGAQGSGSQARGSSSQQGAGSQAGGAQSGQQGGSGSGNTNGSTNGGFGVNVNTAPPAVLKGLFDDREVDPRFLDEIVEYRNLEEEEDPNAASSEEEEENVRYDEWGNEVLDLRAFEDMAEIQQVSGYENLEGAAKDALAKFLSVESHVFSVYVVARRSTSVQGDMDPTSDPEEVRRQEEQGGDSLVRVVRAVYWRKKTDEGVSIVPLVRWEVLDYLPLEVLDYPDEDR